MLALETLKSRRLVSDAILAHDLLKRRLQATALLPLFEGPTHRRPGLRGTGQLAVQFYRQNYATNIPLARVMRT